MFPYLRQHELKTVTYLKTFPNTCNTELYRDFVIGCLLVAIIITIIIISSLISVLSLRIIPLYSERFQEYHTTNILFKIRTTL
jgi:hypothetical protein